MAVGVENSAFGGSPRLGPAVADAIGGADWSDGPDGTRTRDSQLSRMPLFEAVDAACDP